MSKRKSKKTTEKEVDVVEVEENDEVKVEESLVETEESSSPEVKDPTETYPEYECRECDKPIYHEGWCCDNCFEASML